MAHIIPTRLAKLIKIRQEILDLLPSTNNHRPVKCCFNPEKNLWQFATHCQRLGMEGNTFISFQHKDPDEIKKQIKKLVDYKK